MHLAPNLREALAWRIIAELMRRHGGRYEVARLHPSGGQNDCLSLIEQGSPRLMLSVLGGSLTVWRDGDGESHVDGKDIWLPMLSSEGDGRGLSGVLDRASTLLGEVVPSPLPSTTRPVLATRVLAAASMTVALDRRVWQWASGYADTSGYGGGARRAWFARFPGASAAMEQAAPGPRELPAAYRYWFWTRDGEPQICVGSDGVAYGPDGWEQDLMTLYAERRRIGDAVYRGLRPALV